MGNLRDELTVDLQASAPEIQLGLTRAGVTGVQKAIRIRHEGHEKTFAAEISCTVDLDPAQKGVHMSRFPELFGEAIDEVVIGEAFLVETLAEHIARHVVYRQDALRAEVRIEAQYPLARRTPVTGLPTQEIATLIGIAAARRPSGSAGSSASRRGGSTPVRARKGSCAARRPTGLLEAGFADGDIERILELVPLATHNQRGQGHAARRHGGTDQRRAPRRHRRALDELAGLRAPQAAGRAVRRRARTSAATLRRGRCATRTRRDARAASRTFDDDDFVSARQLNLETIHRHDVVAERSGTVGELRRELQGAVAARHTELRDWLSAS